MTKTPLVIFGTRPEYLKIKSLVSLFESQNQAFTLLQILQHEDLTIEESTKSYYAQRRLEASNTCSRLTNLVSEISKAVEPFILNASAVFVQGDTATAFVSALCAFHSKVPIWHIEAGLRTFDLQNPFPEEAYRSMISRLASYHLCPDESAKQNLLQEKVSGTIAVTGNTILDLVKSYGFTPTFEKKVLITIHRRENWDQLPTLVKQLCKLAEFHRDYDFFWILHPNPTIQAIVKESMIELANFHTLQPLPHKELCSLIASSSFIYTDSGGIQEEASFLGKQCYVIRKVTERSAIPPSYIHIVSTPDDIVRTFESSCLTPLPPCKVYGDGSAAESILEIFSTTTIH